MEDRQGIGTLGEKTLHAVIKNYLEPDTSKHEITVGSFVADIVSDTGIIEIQTRSFDRLRKKLEEFLKISSVTVVYPLPKTKWLLWINSETGEITKKRKSPKRGCIQDSIPELYKIKMFLNHPNFRLFIVLIDLEEYRYLNGWSEDKKKGSTRHNRVPVEIVEVIEFNTTADYIRFIPAEVKRQFTTRDYSTAAKVNLHMAQTTLHILHFLGVIRRVGKQGNLHVYERN